MSIEFDDQGDPIVAFGLNGYVPPELVRFDGQLYFVMDGYDDTWGPYTPGEALAIIGQVLEDVDSFRQDPDFEPTRPGTSSSKTQRAGSSLSGS